MAELRAHAERSVPTAVSAHGPTQRIDKYLWYVRLAKSRSTAHKLAEDGHVRVNGRRVERAHAPVRAGDLITFPYNDKVRVVRVAALPDRRGSALDAQHCYEEIVVGEV